MEWFEVSDGIGADGRKGKYRIMCKPEGWVAVLNGRMKVGGPAPESQLGRLKTGVERYDEAD